MYHTGAAVFPSRSIRVPCRCRRELPQRRATSSWMSQDLSADETERILRARARALAKPLEEPSAPAETLDLLVLGLAGERYGVDAAHVLEVIQLPELVPVPCTPPVVLGVVNHRGRVLAVLDLRRLFDLAVHEPSKASRAVIVEAAGMTFGIFSDAVEGLGADPRGLGTSKRHQAVRSGGCPAGRPARVTLRAREFIGAAGGRGLSDHGARSVIPRSAVPTYGRSDATTRGRNGSPETPPATRPDKFTVSEGLLSS
ncbi:MAG: chemotaxis protein CheW [Candidatus Rokubacteria bacterium]|nr:chemotaxis protein CheW [Candidatus Rokubacteria bacterium]